MKNRRSVVLVHQEAAEQCAEPKKHEEDSLEAASSLSETEVTKEQSTQADSNTMIDFSTQTENKQAETQNLKLVQAENKLLNSKLFGVAMIQGKDDTTKSFTGLPSWSIFFYTFMFLSPCVDFDNGFFAVLVKLRLNLFTMDLASKLGISSNFYICSCNSHIGQEEKIQQYSN